MSPRELLQANLRLIEGIVDRLCRRAGVRGADVDDFAATVKLKLVENDYSVLRKYRGRASLSTYLHAVIERWLANHLIHEHGRWHPSAEAQRMGMSAMLLESLISRDHRSIDDAFAAISAIDATVTRKDLETILARLPERRPHITLTALDAVPPRALLTERTADVKIRESETRILSSRAGRVIREAVKGMSAEDRTILRLRFSASMSIAGIARTLGLRQRPLYRRLESLLNQLRCRLADEHIDASEIADVLESPTDTLNFGLTVPLTAHRGHSADS